MDDVTSWPVGVFALTVFVVVLVLLVRSALEVPSGEGVPGPAEWARQEQEERR